MDIAPPGSPIVFTSFPVVHWRNLLLACYACFVVPALRCLYACCCVGYLCFFSIFQQGLSEVEKLVEKERLFQKAGCSAAGPGS